MDSNTATHVDGAITLNKAFQTRKLNKVAHASQVMECFKRMRP